MTQQGSVPISNHACGKAPSHVMMATLVPIGTSKQFLFHLASSADSPIPLPTTAPREKRGRYGTTHLLCSYPPPTKRRRLYRNFSHAINPLSSGRHGLVARRPGPRRERGQPNSRRSAKRCFVRFIHIVVTTQHSMTAIKRQRSEDPDEPILFPPPPLPPFCIHHFPLGSEEICE